MKPIEEMTGLELREAVAVEVMGWTRDEDGWDDHGRLVVDEPLFESSIEAAFQVVDAVHNRTSGTTVFTLSQLCPGSADANEFTAEFRVPYGEQRFYGEGDAAPLAICRAALKATRAK